MKCSICGGNMIHMDIHKNDGVPLDEFKPETYVCEDCDNIEYI